MEDAIHEEINLGTASLPKKYLYVDLDCLFDTRLPLATMFDPINVMLMSETGKYEKRKKDIFGKIPEVLFKRIYSTRTKHILELAGPTPLMDFVSEAYADMTFDVSRVAYDFDTGIFINMFPYEFTGEELDVLRKLFQTKYEGVNIEFLHMSNQQLEPKFVRKNIGVMIKYDLLFWLEYHCARMNLFQNHILEVQCIAPMLGMGTVPTKDLTVDYFKSLQKHHGKLAKIEFLPVYMFSQSLKDIDWKEFIKEE